MKTVKMTMTRALHESKHRVKALKSYATASLPLELLAVWGNKRKTDTQFIGSHSVTVESAKLRGAQLQASLNDNFKNLISLRCAIVKSNSVTKVKLNGKEYTVGELIQYREQLPEFIEILQTICAIAPKTRAQAEVKNDQTRKTLEASFMQVAVAAASATGGKSKTASLETMEQVETAMQTSGLQFEDPSKTEEWATKELQLAEELLREIDFVLSEANARTEIEVEYV